MKAHKHRDGVVHLESMACHDPTDRVEMLNTDDLNELRTDLDERRAEQKAQLQVARVENFMRGLYALPHRLADTMAKMHPYDVADALADVLSEEPPVRLAEWERALLDAE